MRYCELSKSGLLIEFLLADMEFLLAELLV
jgi:hypothetical protein